MAWWFKIPLWGRVMAALVLGIVVGLSLQSSPEVLTAWFKPVGDVFTQAIRMLVVPLIVLTLIAGVTQMGDPRKLGSIGLKTVIIFACTTFVAVSIGMGLALLIQPGVGVDVSAAVPRTPPEGANADVLQRFLTIIPANPVKAMVDGDVLALIFFSILFGVGLVLAGEKAEPASKAIEGASEGMLQVTRIIMEFAPFGVFALVAWVSGTQGAGLLLNLAKLALIVYVGCILHALIVYGFILKVIARVPLIPFFRGLFDAMAIAFSTASSNATLPVNIRCTTENLGVPKPIASAVLPLGATINMDGSALYLGAAAVFAAQVFGVPLDWPTLLAVGATVVLASVGAAGIPSAATILLATVLAVMHMSPEQSALIIGFILAFDRLLDMMRTTVNITGDAATAVTVARLEGELDEAAFRAPDKA
jgi:Na+/H+-dicarboxylate symporter